MPRCKKSHLVISFSVFWLIFLLKTSVRESDSPTTSFQILHSAHRTENYPKGNFPTGSNRRTTSRITKDMGNLTQDDPLLISLIRDQYLVPPAGPTQKLNLSREIWRSPVVAVVQKLLHNKTNGNFLECGALDGEYLSNTIELEHYFNWKGVLVEADPNSHKRLLEKRRKSWIAPFCLSPKPHAMKTKMVKHKIHRELSNITEFQPIHQFSSDFNKSYEVNCFPLYSVLLAAFNRTEIDYLSLDVDGAEWQIIQTIPFDKLHIKVISLEISMQSDYQKVFETINKYLESKGYVYQTKISTQVVQDVVFAHKS